MTTRISKTHPSASTKLLARLLETPDLAYQIQALPPTALAKLVDHVGLEDAGEIVALATTEQLETIFDDHLWSNDRPGAEERFDDERFVLWLEAMLEAGDALVARKLAELPEDLVALALNRRILVIPLDALMNELGGDADDAEATEKALSNRLSEEFDEYVVVARRPDGWDAVLAALLALDRDHHDVLVRLLERCAALTERYVHDTGSLFEALTAEETLESDVAADREDRRTRAGYVAPRAAAAFLELARTTDETAPTKHDPLTRAYFRDAGKTHGRPQPSNTEGPKRRPDLMRLLDDAGIVDTAAPPLLPQGKRDAEPPPEPPFVRAMQSLAGEDPELFAERSEELAYVANVLVAAGTIDGRRVRPIEAVRAAIAICDLGLRLVRAPESNADDFAAVVRALEEHPVDGLFRLGWRKVARGPGPPDLRSILGRFGSGFAGD